MDALFSSMQNLGIIITIGSVAITVVVLFFVFRVVGRLNQSVQQTQQVLLTGEPAEATIMGIANTGTMINNNPMIEITLNVEPTGRAAYQTTSRMIVPLIRLPQVQPGQRVAVAIDRANPLNVALKLR